MSTRGNTDTSNPLPTTDAEFQERLLQFIAQYEAFRPGNKPPNGCTYKQFLGCQPLHFNGTGGAVAFMCWIEKTDSNLRASKCAPED
ncbi:hypothetical protein Hdeb2414_s0237g00843581 [Helianthus debilis subsp. tardiflorus]